MTVYLAINFGSEGWKLEPFLDVNVALNAVKKGSTYGNEWKILKELEVVVKDD